MLPTTRGSSSLSADLAHSAEIWGWRADGLLLVVYSVRRRIVPGSYGTANISPTPAMRRARVPTRVSVALLTGSVMSALQRPQANTVGRNGAHCRRAACGPSAAVPLRHTSPNSWPSDNPEMVIVQRGYGTSASPRNGKGGLTSRRAGRGSIGARFTSDRRTSARSRYAAQAISAF
jgi:hypothetical protein